jgi:hypothetical protein
MSIKNGQSLEKINEEAIREYLVNTPLFFERNLDILQSIKIPQDNGLAVSLVERQMSVLREKNTDLEGQLTRLLERVKVNQQLSEKIRVIILNLLKSTNICDCLRAFEKDILSDFSAAEAGVFVFGEGAEMDIMERVHIDSLQSLGSLPSKNAKPILGPITSAQREVLFGSTQEKSSAVILPIASANWLGVVVIVSDDPNKYEAGMASDFLEYLGEIIVLIVNRALDSDCSSTHE